MTDAMDIAYARELLRQDAALPPRRDRRQRRLERRARAGARCRAPVPEALQAHDPLARPAPSGPGPAARLALWLLGAGAAHAALLGLALLGTGLLAPHRARPARERVRLEVREQAARPPPQPQAERPPTVAPRPPAPRKAPPPTAPPPAVAAAPPPVAPVPPPAAAPAGPAPRRVVGLSLESTVEGGAGPAFAVGNTRLGETAAQAEAPEAVQPLAPASSNRVATRAPRAGVPFTPPARTRPVTPDYPASLRAQGIEGDVVLRVDLDAAGAVLEVAVLKGSGHAALDEAARAAAASERYSPARRDGAAIPDVLTFTVRFRLTDG